MLPYINIFGFQIPSYGLLIFIGVAIGTIIAIKYFTASQITNAIMIVIILFIKQLHPAALVHCHWQANTSHRL